MHDTHTAREKKTREYSNSFHRNAREARKNHPPRKRARSRERKTYLYLCAFTLSTNFFVKEKEEEGRREKNGFNI